MKNHLILYCFLLISFSAFGQTKSTKAGDEFFHKRMYKEALKSYLDASQGKDKDLFYLHQQIAKTFNRLYDYENAFIWYGKLDLSKKENTAENLYEYGQVLRNLELYDQAKEVFADYATKPNAKIKQEQLQNLCDWPIVHQNTETNVGIQKTNIQTGSRSIGCDFYKAGIVYAKPQSDQYKSKTTFYDLAYSIKKGDANFSSSTVLSGDINRSFYDGAPSFTSDQKTLYFTSNSSSSQNLKTNKKKENNDFSTEGVNVLKIYSTTMKKGSWTKKYELNFNNREYNCAFPHVSPDGQTLYFASDMPGGHGLMDIYYATKTSDSTWSAPVNMGPEINTFENEIYPYTQGDHFYFSSKGKPGYGGADIFRGNISGTKISDIENMGKPINSPKDDFAFILHEDGDYGYFSSNREGDNGYDYIYYFETIEEEVAEKQKDQKDKSNPISAIKIEIQRPEPAPVVEKKPAPKPAPIKTQPQAAPQVGQVMVLNNIYFDFDRSRIRSRSFPILDNLVNILKLYPSTVIELSAHTDAAGDDEYNLDLSHSRAKACHQYLIKKGISSQRIIPVGYGETRLVNDCKNWKKCNEEENQLNRRVEVKFLSPIN